MQESRSSQAARNWGGPSVQTNPKRPRGLQLDVHAGGQHLHSDHAHWLSLMQAFLSACCRPHNQGGWLVSSVERCPSPCQSALLARLHLLAHWSFASISRRHFGAGCESAAIALPLPVLLESGHSLLLDIRRHSLFRLTDSAGPRDRRLRSATIL